MPNPNRANALSARQRVAAGLMEARRELIDLSRRNRLLHATRTGSRPHCLEIIGADPDELFVALNRESKQFGFAPVADPETSGEVPGMRRSAGDEDAGRLLAHDRHAEAPEKSRPTRHALLQTKLAAEPLARRLLKLFREARTYEEEQGVNILFLAIGFIHWFEDPRSQERCSAPLLLVPVSLERRQGREPFVLRGRDDDLMPNVSLAEKLRAEFGIVLPEPPAGDEWRPATYLDTVATAIAGRQRWELEPAGIGLGFFTFSKFLMWRDLDAGAWPDSNGLLANPLIIRLLGEDQPREVRPPLAGDDEPIERHIDLAAAVHVVDADSSQALCIEEARQGRDLVVQGPPGTGKSQTIANIIAAAANDGKSVLFVAEKAAALDVVHTRLKTVGLDALCLELHSRKATKTSVLASLDRAIHIGGAAPSDGRTVVELRAARDRLNRWSATLHREIRRSGRTPYQVIGTVLKRRAEGAAVPDQPLPAADWDRDRLREAEAAVERAATTITRLATAPIRHAWHGTFADPLTPFDAERLGTALKGADECARRLFSLANKSMTLLGIGEDASCAALRDQLQALRLLAQAPEAGREALSQVAWRDDRGRIAELLGHGQTWMSTNAELSGRVVEGALDRDITLIRQAIAAHGKSVFRWFVGRHRKAVANLRDICRERPPRRLKDRLGLLDDLLTAQAARERIHDQDAFGQSVLGSLGGEGHALGGSRCLASLGERGRE